MDVWYQVVDGVGVVSVLVFSERSGIPAKDLYRLSAYAESMCNCNQKQARLDNMTDVKNMRETIKLNDLAKKLNLERMNVIGVVDFNNNFEKYKLFEAVMGEGGTLYGCVKPKQYGDDEVIAAYILPGNNLAHRLTFGQTFTQVLTAGEAEPKQVRMKTRLPMYFGVKAIVEGGKFVEDVKKNGTQTKLNDFTPKKQCERNSSFANRMNFQAQKCNSHPLLEEIINQYKDAMKNNEMEFDDYYKNSGVYDGCKPKQNKERTIHTTSVDVTLSDDGTTCIAKFKRNAPGVALTFEDICDLLQLIEREW